jgi:hypothetical protein
MEVDPAFPAKAGIHHRRKEWEAGFAPREKNKSAP